MKAKLLCLIAFLCISESVNAQYKSIFGKSNVGWHTTQIVCDAVFCDSFYAKGDTIISGKKYKKVRYDYEDMASIRTRHFLREDTLFGRVWSYDSSYGKEYMSMNMSLSKGDTFQINAYTHDVAIADSVYMDSGRKCIRFAIEIGGCGTVAKLTFIEGIGPNAGLFYQKRQLSDYLLSVYKDDSLVYKGAKYSSFNCAKTGIEKTIADVESLHIFPEPFHSRFQVLFSNDNFFNMQIRVSDLMGKIVFTEKMSGNSNIIDLGNEASGIYIIHFMDPYGNETVKKLMKID